MARLDTERQWRLEPERMKYALGKIVELGFEVSYQDNVKFCFEFKGCKVTLFPYSGWHTGRTINDGRGLENLLKQLKP